MLKKYKITVEGKAYEVEVEDLGTAVSSQAVSAPAVTSVAVAAPAPVESKPIAPAAQAAPVAPKAPPADPKGEVLRAPMPGTILSVSASVGKTVKRGDILLILEAMKMENEIVAHIDGTIAAIYVQKGSSVNAGETLVAFA
jgi:glutaconyl-CoA decarboxylase